MKKKHPKILNKHKKIRFLCFLLTLSVVLGTLALMLISPANAVGGSIDLNDPRSDTPPWRIVDPYSDPNTDQQTGGTSVSQDIVGDETYPSAYIQFSDDGSELALRIRVTNCDKTPENPEFKNFAFMGLDINLDGKIDFFLGVYNPTGNNGRVGIYLADPALPNTGPGNTGVTKPVATFQPRAGENYSFLQVEYDDGFPGFHNDPDYFITFKFTLADINKALAPLGLEMTPATAFSYVVGTATQDNSLNADINGMDGIGGGDWYFPPPISTDGTEYFTVTFDKNGGDFDASPNKASVKDGDPIPSTQFPTQNPLRRGGWKFVGWSTDPDDTEALAHEFLPGTIITENKTVYAIWVPQLSETLDEDIVHFDPTGGYWNGSPPITYQDRMSEDGIVKDMPPDPTNPPAGALPNNTQRIFGGWVTDLREYNVPGANNVLRLTTGSAAGGDINFFNWTDEVTNLTKVYQPHSGEEEYTVYALWLDISTNVNQIPPKYIFYDNIYPADSTPPPYGTHLYDVYTNNSGTPAYIPVPPTRQGYVFRGWDTNPNAPVNGSATRYLDVYGTNTPLPALNKTDMTVYAIWEPANYALQFFPNDIDLNRDPLRDNPGGTFDIRLCPSVNNNLLYPQFPAPPELEGYEFVEWNTDPYGFGYAVSPAGIGDIISEGGEIRFHLLEETPPDLIQGVTVSGYTKLYAIWRRIPTPPFFVNFDAMGGEFNGDLGEDYISIITDNGYVNGTEYVSKAPPRWTDPVTGDDLYIFQGWSYDDGPDRQVDFYDPRPVIFGEEVTLYAVWKPNIQYTVTFYPTYGTWPDGSTDPITVPTIDGTVAYIPFLDKAPGHPISDTLDFTGWNMKSDGSGAVYDPKAEVTENLHVYAQWVPREGNVMVTFIVNDDTNNTLGSYVTAEGTALLEFPNGDPKEENGWEFLGWFTGPDYECDKEWEANDPFYSAHTILYGKWNVRIRFDLNGAPGTPPADEMVPYIPETGSPVAEPAEPIWPGHSFEGWFKDEQCTEPWDFQADAAEAPMTLYAKWEETGEPPPKPTAPFMFTKVDSDNDAKTLKGAVFGLYKRNENEEAESGHTHDEVYYDGSACWVTALTADVKTLEDGIADFGDLEEGEYILVELAAPPGYRRPSGQWLITVTPESGDPIDIKCVGSPKPPAFIVKTLPDNSVEYCLPNMTPFWMPAAGGAGTLDFMIVGFAIMIMTAAMLLIFFNQTKSKKFIDYSDF
ncbi:MAG: InlB B-repeat-containing protein [Oscillospiraceae bacterium]|nr:InlB B-repeat-containing protein [Oscillospiraceae bacterium]